jgi:putative addiction module CopG family antidote
MDLNDLPADLEQFVQQEIAKGKFASVEEVINAALRMFQEHETQGGNGQQSINGYPDQTPRSADGVIRAIKEALATGEFGLARKLAMDGAKQYPDHEELQKYGHILAPPTAGKSIPVTPEKRAARKANRAWMNSHWQDYRGNWIALRAGQLLHASPSFYAVIAQVGDVRGGDILLTKIA